MTGKIITAIIVVAIVIYAIAVVVKKFNNIRKGKYCSCSGCGADCKCTQKNKTCDKKIMNIL